MAPALKDKQVWQKPPTHFYEDNYRFGINFYQPMVDYLNAKESNTKTQVEYPHLPWNNERGLYNYGSRKVVRAYSQEDLRKLTEQAEDQARYNLDQFKVAKRSDFSLSKSVSAASLSKHLASVSKKSTVSVDTKQKKKKCVKMADSNTETDVMLQEALKSAEKFHINRSAKAIEGALRFESLKNLSENTEMDIKSYQRQQVITAVHDTREHNRVMKTHHLLTDEVDQIMRPLDTLKLELKGFDKKATNYFEEKSLAQNICRSHMCITA